MALSKLAPLRALASAVPRAPASAAAARRAVHRFKRGGVLAPVPTAAAQVQTPFPLAQRPESKSEKEGVSVNLDTRRGRVVLPGPDLRSTRRDLTAASPRRMATPLLSDGKPRSPKELESFRAEILEYFHDTFTMSEKLHEVLSSAPAFYEKHEQLRHPPIFYLGHTASFYVNKLHLGKYITERIDPVLEMQMAVGVDEMSWDDLDSNSYVWPSGAEARADEARATDFLQKVLDFRRDVRVLVDKMIRTQPVEWPVTKSSFWWVIVMGIEHERIHLETSSVIHRQAALESVQDTATFPRCERGRFHSSPDSFAARSMPPNRLIPVEKGTTRLGRTWEGTKTYGWDNEFGEVKHVEVPAFSASEHLVTNQEFLGFVREGGYNAQRFWTEDGWKWVCDMRPTQPRFWRQHSDGYFLRTLCSEVAMPWDWPAEVCHHEAAAYCRYLSEKTGKSLRLPLEDEFLRLRDSVATDLQDSAHGPAWGDDTPGNVNLAYWASPCPVDTFRSPSGVCDVLGNVWQHCLTPIDVLEGFTTHPLYDDFTTPTVGELHMRIMGGSWMSTGCNGATRDSRYGFRRHFYQHAGFRYVETDRPAITSVIPFESERALCDAFRFHFDAPVRGESFHARLAQRCAQALGDAGVDLASARTLELGCGPGRAVLELARQGVGAAHGADRSAQAFQCTAQRLLAEGGQLRWLNYLEGEFVAQRQLSATGLDLEGNDIKDSVQFFQMPDFAALDTQKFSDYDLVVCAQPGFLGSQDALSVLKGVHELLRPDGLLVVGTQYEWSAEDAAPGAATGEEVLAAVLLPWFEPVAAAEDLPWIRTHTARRHASGAQHVTFWRKRQERLSEDAPEVPHKSGGIALAEKIEDQAMYSKDTTVAQYLDFHFGPRASYPVACARRCVEAAAHLGVPLGRALEVGGGPGRASMELSRAFGHVDGGDLSPVFVDLGRRLLQGEKINWRVLVDNTSGATVARSATAADLTPGSVSLMEMDAQALPASLKDYDLICGFNLIDRLARPKDFLLDVKGRLNTGGLLVLSSPYSWSESFTAKEDWLGGFKYGDNDGPSSYAGLQEFMVAQGFKEALAPDDLWFDLDELENGRKKQTTRAQMTFWQLL